MRTWCIFGLLLLVFAGCQTPRPGENIGEQQELDSLLHDGINKTYALKFDSARRSLFTALAKARAENNPKYILLVNLNIGGLYHHLNAQDQALNYYFKSLDIAKEYHLDNYLNSIYNNIGVVYSQNDSYKEAVHFFSEALKISRVQGEKQRIGMNLINLGIALGKLKRDSEAVASLEEASQLFTSLQDTSNLGVAMSSLGDNYLKKGEYAEALEYYHKAHNIESNGDRPWFRWELALSLGKTYCDLKVTDSAKIYLKEAIRGFKETDNTPLLIEAYTWMSKVEQDQGNLSDALAYATESLNLKDTVLVKKTSKWVSDLQVNYEFGKKEKQIELLKETAHRRQLIWIGGIIAVVTIGLLLIFNLRSSNRLLTKENVILEKEQEVNRLRVEKEMAEHEKLRKEVEFKNRELVGKAMHLVSKNELLSKVQEMLINWKNKSIQEQATAVEDAGVLLKSAKNLDEEWESFKIHFEEVHPKFFKTLLAKNPHLNSGDLRMCAYLMLNLSPKEIAQILNISPDSIRKKKQRLREKLGLSPETDLIEWLREMKV